VLLLVTIGLVLVGAVSLVIGFASNALGWIYLSILCSLVAAGVLVLFSRMSRRQAPADAGEPASLATDAGAGADEPTAVVPVAGEALAGVGAPDVEVVTVLAISGYDGLRVNEILPRLGALSLDELDAVREHEEQGKNRGTVLTRIDDLMDQKAAVEGAPVVAGAAAAASGAAAAGTEAVADLEEGIDDLIEDYDNLRVNQILPLLDQLDDDELEDVADYEEANKNRASIIDRVDQLLGEGEGVPEAVAAPVKKAPVKKAPVKRALAKKAAAASKKAGGAVKKAAAAGPAKKASGPAKKAGAPAKKAGPPAKKAAPTAVKKAAAPAVKKAAPSGPAKKAAAAGPAKKAAAAGPAKKAPAKKAGAPAKKAAKAAKKR
jgi:hypothetical protein